jgi:hypothetical protein
MDSEDRKAGNAEAGKIAQRRAFLRRFGAAAAAAPVATVLLSSRTGHAFGNGNKKSGASAGFS